MINLDLFSYSIFNSYIVFTKIDNVVLIRNIIDGDEDFNTLAKIDLNANNLTHIECGVEHLTMYGSGKRVEFSYIDVKTLIVKTNFKLKVDVEPQKYEFASKIENNCWNINLHSKKSKMLLTSEKNIDVEQIWNVISSENLQVYLNPGISNITVSSDGFKSESYIVKTNINQAKLNIKENYTSFWNIKNIDYECTSFASKYILWSGFVKAKGNLKYDACYMSKNIMTNIWSWDNCFVSLGLAKEQPRRAYEQFMAFYHVQSKYGNFPDFMNPNYISYDFTKPPVQGVIYRQLLKINKQYFSNPIVVSEVIDSSKKLVHYWTNVRTFTNKISLPYNTHGNDTGLDNASVFENAVEIRTPDLFTYLIILMEVINELEQIINIEITDYKQLINEYVCEIENKMVGDHTISSYNIHTGEKNDQSMCIIELIPLLISDKLSPKTNKIILNRLKSFKTQYGIASESPNSIYYNPKGYWRGPIWAPTTCLMYIALSDAGEHQISNDIKESYITMCEENGYAENFDALTGEGLSDKSFAWTAAVYKFFKETDEK